MQPEASSLRTGDPTLAAKSPWARHLPAAVWVVAAAVVLLLAPSLTDRLVNWRESDVLMVGRNFCRSGTPLWLPQIDQAGDASGITGMEFPLLNFIGGHLACGGAAQVLASRLLILAFGLLSLFSLASLARRHLGAAGAWTAIVGFAFSPVVFFYARTIQPDVPSLALGLLALDLFDRSLPADAPTRWPLYFGSAVAMALGALIKLPVIVYGLPLVVWLFLRRGKAALRPSAYWLYLPLSVLPPLAWYAYAKALQDQYGIHYFYLGTSFPALVASWLDPTFYKRIYAQRLFDSYACPLISALGVGFLLFRWRQTPGWIRALAIAAVIFFFLGGESAAWHTSYGLVAVPAVVLSAGAAVDALLSRARRPIWFQVVAVGLVLVAAFGLWRTRSWFSPSNAAAPFEEAKQRLDGVLETGARVLVLSDGDPKLLWYLDRKGWVVGADVARQWFGEEHSQPLAAAVDMTRLKTPQLREAARTVLTEHGFTPLLEHSQVELWTRAR
ncbi:glycosyltransferase family 39 protein [Vitiosangium sp. GDMCC 1.1324]|uniref:ArnT family glycosyltransferase n=1 Tax=Vitiosangium sp. (strain GDMCC 1.1324) TaxID=2138576 RepID=UPI000D334BED|nr:glycosyltransferase family 39 protein [Vitiosangium sp. GDMCC 1.1324]PTL84606.1 hypothetical protein DAT35_05930 [Vitiosangium sp. GDMCC 1.1324]